MLSCLSACYPLMYVSWVCFPQPYPMVGYMCRSLSQILNTLTQYTALYNPSLWLVFDILISVVLILLVSPNLPITCLSLSLPYTTMVWIYITSTPGAWPVT